MDSLHNQNHSERIMSAVMPMLVTLPYSHSAGDEPHTHARMINTTTKTEAMARVSENETMEPAELHRLLRCTESLPNDEMFYFSESQSLNSDHSNEKPINMSKTKNSSPRTKPSPKRAPKPRNVSAGPKERKSKNTDSGRKRQPRAKKIADDPIFEEIIQIDDQSVVPVKDVVGDMEFEDLEAEDLELLRYLPSPGNMQIVDSCAESLSRLREFQRKLRQFYIPDKDSAANEADHDSDATISIVSENPPETADSTTRNPTHDMAMLMTYRHIFDPPVPAVITIPTYMVTVDSPVDWETETAALQHLLKKSERPHHQHEPAVKRKRTDDPGQEERVNQYLKRLVTAIEIKSNQIVNMKETVFSIQKPLKEERKYTRRPKSAVEKPDIVPVEQKISSLDAVSKAKALVSKLDLDPFCVDILMTGMNSLDSGQAKDLARFHKKRIALENDWNRKGAYIDEGCLRDLHGVVTGAQKRHSQLKTAKDRAVAVVNEKYVLDVDEIEKRTNSSTEKAKTHVTNMFEENRRQFDLQRTLDFATCKCDVFAINTRNMRRRGEMQPQYARLFEDIPTAAAANPGSPPHTSQSNMVTQNIHGIKRRRNNFASSVKEILEEREIYDDLLNINRMLKEDPTRAVSSIKSADVIPDNNRLVIDGKPFHRNQEILVEHYEEGKFTGSLLQFSQTEIMVKRCGDGQRLRFPLGLVMDKKIVLKKKASPTRGVQNGPSK